MGYSGKVGTGTVGSGGTVPNQSPLTEDDVAPAHSKRSPAFQFYPSDFFASAKVDRMPMVERGCYITLLARCWLDNGLSTDLSELAHICRMKPTQFARMWEHSQIGKCFHERGGKFHNDRLDREGKKQAEYRRRQSDNAEKGWQRRRNATASPPQSQHQPSGNALLSSSPISSPSLPSGSSAHPIIGKRRPYAALEFGGGIYVPQQTYRDLLEMHPDGFEPEFVRWCESVAASWQGRNTGTDMVVFWKARHNETWPPEKPEQSTAKPKPAWYKPAAGQS